MATIVKRNNKYHVQIRRKGFPSVSRTFHRHSDAAEWGRYMESKADRGEMPTPIKVLNKYTVKDILQRYKDEISIKKLSYNTEQYVLDTLMRQPFGEGGASQERG